jgi:tetratricopeptide (TPR) repeat protein
MPRANPESCLETAARHLFRHLNDWNALRQNPLVRALRLQAKKAANDEAVLAEVHRRILAIAKLFCNESASTGSETAARRQLEIVVALCRGEAPVHTAARLDLSRRQYYRERRVICLRLSRALLRDGGDRLMRFEVADELRLNLARAEALVDLGFSLRAADLLENVRSSIPSGIESVAVDLRLADTFMSLGLTDRAQEILRICGAATPHSNGDPAARSIDDVRVLMEARLAIETGRDADAGSALESLVRRRVFAAQASEESLTAILECGNWCCQNGKFARARRMLRHAQDLTQRLPHLAPKHQIGIALLAAHCAEDSVDEFGLEHHWLREALMLSTAHGSTCGMLEALHGLMNYHASTSNADEVYALANESLRVARCTEGTRILADTGIEVATMILRTRFWRTAEPLIFEVEKLTHYGTLRWTILKHLQGSYLLRRGRYEAGEAALQAAYEITKRTNNRRLKSIVVRDLAVALHANGSAHRGAELMKHAVELAEGYSGLWSLWNTYEVAARLLGDRRLIRLARQARAALSTRTDRLPPPSELRSSSAREVRPHLSLFAASSSSIRTANGALEATVTS